MFTGSIVRGTEALGLFAVASLGAAAAAAWIGFGASNATLERVARLIDTERAVAVLQADLFRQTKAVYDRALLGRTDIDAGVAAATLALDFNLSHLEDAPTEVALQMESMMARLHETRTMLQVAVQRPPTPAELRAAFDSPGAEATFVAYQARVGGVQSALAGALALEMQSAQGDAVFWRNAIVGLAAGIAAALALALGWFARAIRRPIAALVQIAETTAYEGGPRHAPARAPVEFQPLGRALDRMIQALAQSREAQLRSETQAALGALVPVVAHNIRNPLASIRACAQVAEGEPPAVARESLKAIIATVDRLESWLSSLLGYLNPRQVRFALVKASDAVRGASDLMAHQASERSVRLEADSIDDEAIVWGDTNLIEQALCALIANAIDASPPGGQVRLSVAQGRDECEIVVEDDGPGMPFAYAPKSRASTIEPGPTTKAMGTGLGVPFARRVAELHGGRLSFTGRESSGTRAAFVIPYAPSGFGYGGEGVSAR